VSTQIGRKVAQRRSALKLSAEALANKLGWSQDQVLELESDQGVAERTLADMDHLARVLDIPIAGLLEDTRPAMDAPVAVLHQDSAEVIEGRRDGLHYYTYRCLARTPQIPGLIPLVVDVLVDEETSAPRLNGGHEGDEFIYVLEGTVNFRWVADGNEHLEVLLPGSSAILREGTSHSFTLPAGADAPAKLLAVNL
jgi:transcriptional regulator with XRE-family HTH domain